MGWSKGRLQHEATRSLSRMATSARSTYRSRLRRIIGNRRFSSVRFMASKLYADTTSNTAVAYVSLFPGLVESPQEDFRALLFRIEQQLFGASLLDNLATIKEVNAVGDLSCELQFVRGDNHGHTLARQFPHDVENLTRQLRVQRGRRLVEQQCDRAQGQGSGNADALALSARQFRRTGQFAPGQAYTREVVESPIKGFVLASSKPLDEADHDVLYRGQMRKEVEVLKHHSDLAADFEQIVNTPRRRRLQFLSGPESVTGVGFALVAELVRRLKSGSL